MDFWGTFWPSALGALIGAGAAWGFALDLRRRDRADRVRDRQEEYGESMRREWAALAETLRAHKRAVKPMNGDETPPEVVTAFTNSHRDLARQLVASAAVARGEDHTLVDVIGRGSQLHLRTDAPVRFDFLDEANIRLLGLASCPPDDVQQERARAIARLEEIAETLR